jgi:cation:H+ antiporter
MTSPVALTVFLVGLGVSLAASEVLVSALGHLGARLRLAAGLLGLLVALGADAPEISSAITALISGAKDVGVGVILGSNLFNLAALLGLSAVIAGRLPVHRVLIALDGGVALLATAVVAILLLARLVPALSLVLMAVVVVPYLVLVTVRPSLIQRLPLPGPLRRAAMGVGRTVHKESEPNAALGPVSVAAWWIAPAVAAIVGGSYAMVQAALVLGDRWHLSGALLGTVVLAALTSLPNAYAAVRLALRGNGPAVVSEAFNSNTINLVAGISIPALFIGGVSTAAGAGADLGWLLTMTVAAIGLGWIYGGLARTGGLVLLGIYLAFLAIQFR